MKSKGRIIGLFSELLPARAANEGERSCPSEMGG